MTEEIRKTEKKKKKKNPKKKKKRKKIINYKKEMRKVREIKIRNK
jgi:hypothetical protein